MDTKTMETADKETVGIEGNSASSNTEVESTPSANVEHKTYHDYLGEEASSHGIVYSDDEPSLDDIEEAPSLPDLYDYLRSIQGKDTDLGNDREPQSLFNRPEHLEKYKDISLVKHKVDEYQIKEYVKDFDSHVKDDVLMIANISLEEIQEEEKRLRDAYIALQKQEQESHRLKVNEVSSKGDAAKKRIMKDAKEKRRLLEQMVALAKKRQILQVSLLQQAFGRAENQLQMALKRRKADIERMYGSLKVADEDFGGKKGRRWKVDWDKIPQPIQIKLKSLRGVRDKLPGGNYVMVVSLYNRLGGHLIKWSDDIEQRWGGSTLAVKHDGRFYNAEIKMDQNLYTVLPSKGSIRPGMIIGFELYILRGTVVNTDRVVAWGCFPICDGGFEVVEGKYKAPMLRGEMDLRLDKHSQIEKIIASDLDHWLCNVYFDIVRLPRYMGDQKEYEIELQFSSNLVNHPDRINLDGEEYKDSENPVLGSAVTVNHANSVSDITSLSQGTNKTSSFDSLPRQPVDSDDVDSVGTYGKSRENSLITEQSTTSGTHRVKKLALEDGSDSDVSVNEEEIFVIKKGPEEFQPVPEENGLFSKRHLNNPVDVYMRKLYNTLSKNGSQYKRRQLKKPTYAEELETHTASVKLPFSEKGKLAEKGWQRASYTVRMFLAELGLSEWRSREFWTMLILFIFTFFLRFFLHYGGQFVFLEALGIPVNSFNFLPYTVRLNYQASLLTLLQEMMLVVIGPVSVFAIFVLGVIFCWLSQLAIGMFPDVGCKFVLMLGIQASIDPFFIALVDLIQGTYDYNALPTSVPLADFTKLYWNFELNQGTGLPGVFVTVFAYLAVMFASASVLYMYFLRLHNNGRMLDIYWRLHSDHQQLFVPYDLEVSLQELEYVLLRAEQWRGEDGERRKVAVYEYIWEEEDTEFSVFDETLDIAPKEEKRKEKTTHIAIHTIHLDGLRELYRHFLALPDGAIVEVFGEMSFVPGLTKEIKRAINQGAKKIENLLDLGSKESLRKNLETARSRTDSMATSVATASKIKVQ